MDHGLDRSMHTPTSRNSRTCLNRVIFHAQSGAGSVGSTSRHEVHEPAEHDQIGLLSRNNIVFFTLGFLAHHYVI